MAGGWTRDGAVQEQIDASVQEAVERARRGLARDAAGRGAAGQGEGPRHCEECGDEIPEGRRRAVPGVGLCVACKSSRDRQASRVAGPNRRANKDSQLR